MNKGEAIQYSKEERQLRKALAELIVRVRSFEAQTDSLFAQRNMDQKEREKQIAQLMNALTFENDRALYFGLGFNFRDDTKDSRMVKSDNQRRKSSSAQVSHIRSKYELLWLAFDRDFRRLSQVSRRPLRAQHSTRSRQS